MRRDYYKSPKYHLRNFLLMLKKLDLPHIDHIFGSVDSYIGNDDETSDNT